MVVVEGELKQLCSYLQLVSLSAPGRRETGQGRQQAAEMAEEGEVGTQVRIARTRSTPRARELASCTPDKPESLAPSPLAALASFNIHLASQTLARSFVR